MKVLVTGATSLLGAATAQRLLVAGHEVRTFQRNPSSLDTDEVLGSIDDEAAVTEAASGVDAILHLAALVGVTGAWEGYHRVNVIGTQHVLTAARSHGVERLVYVSSPSVAHAGSSLIGAGPEPADPDRARGHYARSKAMAEILALDSDSGTAVISIRPHLVWGPGDTQLVGRIVDRARAGRLAHIGTGTALIDTTYISNAADALVAGLERCEALDGRAFVVTNGQPRPVGEIIDHIVEAAGLPCPTRRIPATVARLGGAGIERYWERSGRKDDPPMTRFVAEQMSTAHWFAQAETRAALGWSPAVTLDEGFAALRQWYADHRS
ncbi:MAG: NAD-dependent epimerase/dehydratase family protein [Acidimicrobiia bacterium]